MCQARAAADGRVAVGRFRDAVARSLLGRDELALVELARSDGAPVDSGQRLVVSWVRSSGEVVVPRTVAIDEAVCAAGHGQVVVLGAGLDTRPWRLPCLAGAVVYAVDHPASQADTARRAAGLPVLAGRLVDVPVDFSDGGLERELARAGHDPYAATTWVWEGVVPYLTRAQVSATTAAVAGRSAAGSVLVVNYQSRSAVTVVGRRLGRLLARLYRLDDPLADEPWKSLWSPASIQHLLLRHGFTVDRDQDLLTIATQIGSPTTRRRSLTSGRVLIAHRSTPPSLHT
jgi:methyltransferase (TIGR00027 family)